MVDLSLSLTLTSILHVVSAMKESDAREQVQRSSRAKTGHFAQEEVEQSMADQPATQAGPEASAGSSASAMEQGLMESGDDRTYGTVAGEDVDKGKTKQLVDVDEEET
ncbi:hypothetical protein BDZ85DRAFT_260314 [Elsinoe ampelina]|uniref:Uncharacterized protein n=1 Tax=Elsinoe ampelina TaxID=302913 RepID=A0A6A6GF56_9PEZI|nr:hypothetical protein BDZ85DRAFT_260314 [Elsinoe ampelina]